MWNRRKEEENALKPVPAAPVSSAFPKEGIPMSTLPSRPSGEPHSPHLDATRGGSAVIGKSVMIKGQIFSREDLTIDGEVEGTVELHEHRLTIGPNGKVMASVKAREIVVLGTIHGNVETTDKLEIRKDAKLVGDVKTARIVIEDGAYFKGNIDIVRAETARPAPTSKPQQAASGAPANAPVMAAGAGVGDPKR